MKKIDRQGRLRMYKDPDKQKEANRQASQRRRDADKVKGMTAEVSQGMTKEGMMPGMTEDYQYKGENEGLPPLERIPERTAQGNIRVSKPGDADYDGVGVA